MTFKTTNRLFSFLRVIIDFFKKMAYWRSYSKAPNDQDITKISEEQMDDYFKQIRG